MGIRRVLQKERRFVRDLRARRGATVKRVVGDEVSRRLAEDGRPTDLVGLALSGGGIRSATFALGVLEALRDLKLLKQVDYLSTVSGGGFIGGWLVAGCKRQPNWCDPHEGSGEDPWLSSISQLRHTSNYLYPRSGSPYLPMFTIWLRNELLVLTMVLSLLSIALLIPIAAVSSISWLQQHPILLWLAVGFLVGVPLAGYCRILWRLSHRILEPRRGHARAVGWACMSFLAGCALTTVGLTAGEGFRFGWAAHAVGCLIALPVGIASLRKRREWKAEPWGVIRVFLAIATSGCLLSWGLQTVAAFIAGHEWLMTTGPLLLTAAVWGADTVLAGLLGRKQLGTCREWRSGVTALSLSTTLMATAWVWLALFSPWIVEQLVFLTGRAFPAVSVSWVAGAAWALLKRPASTGPDRWWAYVVRVAPMALLFAVLLGVSTVIHAYVSSTHPVFVSERANLAMFWLWLMRLPLEASGHALLGSLAILALTAFCCDINELGWSNFYRNRIVNCYFGAVTPREDREIEELTDLGVRNDDFALTTLRQGRYAGPFPIVNTTVNLAGSRDPSVKSRRAASFFFTPLHYGATFAECETRPFGVAPLQMDITLGRLISISGAAVSPNMGAHDVSKFAFMLTLLNARLGWWLKNPARQDKSGWPLSLYLIKELFAKASSTSAHLYLSDGGHFENLGVYELLRRECGVIIVSDAEQDAEMTMNSLAGLFRMAQVDLGVEICGNLTELAKKPESKLVSSHATVFEISYKPVKTPHVIREKASFGYLVYLKSSLTGDEPPEVLNYAKRAPEFPHESTGDQFFSEAQFESYRCLGLHVARKTFEPFCQDDYSIHRIAEDMKWQADSKLDNESGELTKRLSDLFAVLQGQRDFEFLVAQLHPGWAVPGETPRSQSPAFAAAFMFCQRLLIFAEDACCRLDLEQNHGSPAGTAWMHLFRGWAQSEMMRITWSLTFQYYGFFFNEFCVKRLSMAQLKFEGVPEGIEQGEVAGRFKLLLQPPGLSECFEVGSANTKGLKLIKFKQQPWYRLTQVAPEMRRRLREIGVTSVHENFEIDESSGITGLSRADFIAWWEFPS